MADDLTAHIPPDQSSVRLATAIDLSNLFTTGRASFEVSNASADRDMALFDDDDDEESRIFEFDDPGEGGGRRGVTKNNYEYLKDMSADVFANPPEGTDIKDLLADGSIMKIMIKEGQGSPIPDDCKVFAHYSLAIDGPKPEVFDSTLSYGRCRPEGIDLRHATVLPGFYLALKSMTHFEAAKFLIRFDRAFGEIGCPPRVPPCTDIICTIEVVSFLDEEKLKKIEYMSLDERRSLPFSKIIEFSAKKKQEGNGLYKINNFGGAKRAYFQAANVLEDYPVINEEDNDERQRLLFMLYNNLALCCIKMEKWAQACVACKKGLGCFSDSLCLCAVQTAKIYFRFAIAKRMLGDPTHALGLIDKALKKDPRNKDIKLEKQTILKRIQEDKEISKSLMSRIGKGMVNA